MRAAPLALLLTLSFLLGAEATNKHKEKHHPHRQQHSTTKRSSEDQPESPIPTSITPFVAGREYCFEYNSQVSSGYAPWISGQQASSRLQSRVCLTCVAAEQCVLKMYKAKAGQRNAEAGDWSNQDSWDQAAHILPLKAFEPLDHQDREEMRLKLDLPVEFAYVNGNVERLQFHSDDKPWSKNLKKAVLNLIQLQMTPANGQEIEDEEENGQNKYAKAFTTTETTLEGICPVSYSIMASPKNTTEINITKSINFQRCMKLADVGYGFQVEPTVESPWSELKDSNRPFLTSEQNTLTGLVIPKEKLARSTVVRFVLAKDQKEEEKSGNYGIQRVELLSEYIAKSSQAESSQAMQTIAASELVFVEWNAAGNQETGIVRDAAQNKEEALLYNADLESQEKIYYMFGDERIPNKDSLLCFKTKNSEQEIEKAENHLQELVVAFGEKNQQKGGIESSTTIEHFEKLVHIMRLCSLEELKNLDKKANKIDSSNKQKVAADLFADALAVAATRNTIVLLEKKIKEQSGISEVKAVQVLKVLGRGSGLPAPSDCQVDAILRLCKSDVVSDSKVLKQSCWLTFGAMVGELSLQNNKAKLMKQTTSPMRADETTADHKMQLYKDVLIKQLKEAESIPEKIFALKCIGNAALGFAVPELREVIERRSECPAVRIYAIDALRRLRHQLKPQKIHSIVMPIYMNTDEKPELRMNAFSMVMQTRPSNAIVDQIAFTMTSEKSDDVQSFVYSTMKSASLSPIPEQQTIANQLKNALKLAQINEEQLEAKHLFSYSRRWTAPFYSQQQEEGAFANFVSMFSPRDSMLPSHMSFGLDTYFNGQYNRNALRVTLCQKEIEQLIKQIFEHYQGHTTNDQPNKPNLLNVAAEKLRSIFNKLKIRGRGRQQDKEDEYKQEDQSPYFVISIRMNDVDIGMIPLNMDHNQGTVSQMKQALVSTLRNLFSNSDMKTFQLNTAMVINSRRAVVPTSVGVSLQIHQSMYIVGQVKGSIQANSQSKVKVNFHPNANWVQVQKMEAKATTYSSGVRSSRSVAVNIPLDIAFETTRNSNDQKQTKLSIKVPEKLTRLVVVNSLPTTYLQKVVDATSNSTNLHYYRIKAVENQQFRSQMREINTVMGARGLLNIPLRIHGHFETPRKIFSLKEVVKAIMVGDNHLSVDLIPSHEMSKEIIVTLSAEMFQPDNKSPVTSIHPKLEAFYTSVTTNNQQRNGQVQSTDEESSSEEEEEERRQPAYANQQKKKVTEYLNKYAISQKRNYKHSLKCVVETKGTARTNKAEFKVDGTCDARLRACEANVQAKRSALAGERIEWTMEAQVQTLYPEYVADLEELLDSSIKQHKFFCHIQADWGNTTQKENIRINVLGEPSQRVLRSVQLVQQQQVNYGRPNSKRQIARRAAKMPFVDRYQIVANYRLKPANEHYFANKLECVKANNFWNTESRLVKAEGNLLTTYQSGLHQGQVEGLFSIEPETGRHANVSIQTPSQKVKITGLNLPIKMRPMKLVRPHSSYAASHSASQLVSGMVDQHQARKQNRAECKVGVKTVDTFDKVALRAPISKCYTVLAKDCGDETESKFAILMRSLQTGGEQKKLKIITPSKEIVLEDQVEGRMRIRVDDEQFNMGGAHSEEDHQRQQDREQKLRQHNIRLETDSQGRLLAFVDVDGADVAVKFNGKTAKIQMSEQFKEKQCGLCGNYNDNQDDELRNNENKLSSDVKAFHRSYTLDRDGGECQEDERTNFYERQPADFGHTQPKEVEPVDRTVIMEYNHKLCFSIKPVKQCPQGYFAGEEEEGAKQLLKRPKVSFSCLDRQSIEGQRLRKIVRRTGVADLGEYQPSFYETVVIPETCIQY